MYLISAPPHRQYGDEKAWDALRHVIDDQKLTCDKLADFIETEGGTPSLGEFPMEFTDMHDLSMEYIVNNVLKRQKNAVETIEALSGQLEAGSQARALAQEALGAAKAHVESVSECLKA